MKSVEHLDAQQHSDFAICYRNASITKVVIARKAHQCLCQRVRTQVDIAVCFKYCLTLIGSYTTLGFNGQLLCTCKPSSPCWLSSLTKPSIYCNPMLSYFLAPGIYILGNSRVITYLYPSRLITGKKYVTVTCMIIYSQAQAFNLVEIGSFFTNINLINFSFSFPVLLLLYLSFKDIQTI